MVLLIHSVSQHIGESVVKAVQQASYDQALTAHYGFNTLRANPHLLQCIEVISINISWW